MQSLEEALLIRTNETSPNSQRSKELRAEDKPAKQELPVAAASAGKGDVAELTRKLESLQAEHFMACKSNIQLSDKNARLEEDLETLRTELKAKKSELELNELVLKGK